MKNQARKIDLRSSNQNENLLPQICGRTVENFGSSEKTQNEPQLDSDYKNWLCLFTQPYREKLARESLTELGLEVYLPFQRKLVFRRGRRVSMKAPLFSRYLFVRVDKEAAQVYGAHRQRGVAGFAGRTFPQSLISGRIIEALKSRECPDGFIGLQSALVKAGQKVTILEGPFAAIDAIFSEPKDERRSVLLLSLLGKTHKVVVPNKNLQLVD
jgi:transcriptional antiterminator RfaH